MRHWLSVELTGTRCQDPTRCTASRRDHVEVERADIRRLSSGHRCSLAYKCSSAGGAVDGRARAMRRWNGAPRRRRQGGEMMLSSMLTSDITGRRRGSCSSPKHRRHVTFSTRRRRRSAWAARKKCRLTYIPRFTLPSSRRRCSTIPRLTVKFDLTRALQPVATCRQSPYLHKPATVIVTSFATELATPSVTDVRYVRTDTLTCLIYKDSTDRQFDLSFCTDRFTRSD